MNNQRRKDIDLAIADVEKLDALAGDVRVAIELFREAAHDIAGSVQDICNDEQEAFDNLPESLQQGERGMDMEAAISALETAIETLEDDGPDWDNWSSENIVGSLDEAKGM